MFSYVCPHKKVSNMLLLKTSYPGGEYRGRTDDLLHAMLFGHPFSTIFTNF